MQIVIVLQCISIFSLATTFTLLITKFFLMVFIYVRHYLQLLDQCVQIFKNS
jgi:hypothetical protein